MSQVEGGLRPVCFSRRVETVPWLSGNTLDSIPRQGRAGNMELKLKTANRIGLTMHVYRQDGTLTNLTCVQRWSTTTTQLAFLFCDDFHLLLLTV
jgi:hypothetical protein